MIFLKHRNNLRFKFLENWVNLKKQPLKDELEDYLFAKEFAAVLERKSQPGPHRD